MIASSGKSTQTVGQEMSTPSGMSIYYQVKGGEEKWHVAQEEQRAEIISVYAPRYITVLSTSVKVAEGDKVSSEAKRSARYKGDIYFDWDSAGDLQPAIVKVNQFLDKLAGLEIDLGAVRLFCSGSKGFHAEIPAECYMRNMPAGGIAGLPAIYKEMMFLLYTETMDTSIYSNSRGRMWRVPNVQRENGNYKVQVTAEELRNITPDAYAALVTSSRPLPALSEARYNPALAELFANAAARVTTERAKNHGGRAKGCPGRAADSGDDAVTDAVRDIRNTADAALDHIEVLLPHWLPGGAWEGSNYLALNPMRKDKNIGSFKIHEDGYLIDYACDTHKGGDLVALRRFLDGNTYNMTEAARRVSAEIGLAADSRDEPTDSAPAAKSAIKQPDIGSVMGLLAEEIPNIRWVVPGVLPEGLSLLAGSPKTGKSWMVLEIALAVASGGMCLGGRRAMPGRALYLALEDNRRRLQERIKLILAGGEFDMPEKMDFALEWPRLDQGGLEKLDKWLSEHSDARLVVIDTLAKMRKKQSGNSNLYAQDYEVGEQLKQLSDKYHVAVVLVTHVRKAESQDPLEMVTGTLGLVGGMDGILVLKRERGQGTASLYVTGRDVPEDQYHGLTWDKERVRWKIEGNASELTMSQARREIMTVLSDAGRPKSAKEIAELAGRKLDATRRLLPEMVEDGLIDEIKDRQRCLYVHPRFGNTCGDSNSHATAHSAPTLSSSLTGGVLAAARDAALRGEGLRASVGGGVLGGHTGGNGSDGNSVRSDSAHLTGLKSEIDFNDQKGGTTPS